MDINTIKENIYTLFEELGFIRTYINGVRLYFYDECYYKITYVNTHTSYVIKYASSYDEAVNNMFLDGDWYPLSLGDALIDELRHDLVRYYINKS